jgi:hypothetical protein
MENSRCRLLTKLPNFTPLKWSTNTVLANKSGFVILNDLPSISQCIVFWTVEFSRTAITRLGTLMEEVSFGSIAILLFALNCEECCAAFRGYIILEFSCWLIVVGPQQKTRRSSEQQQLHRITHNIITSFIVLGPKSSQQTSFLSKKLSQQTSLMSKKYSSYVVFLSLERWAVDNLNA